MQFPIFNLLIFSSLISQIHCYDGLIKSLFKQYHDKPSCRCSDIIQPVCGSDSHTYLNICSLECSHRRYHNVQKASDGACNDQSKNKRKKRKHKKTHKGASVEDYSEEESLVGYQNDATSTKLACNCGGVLVPICGSDGVTYLNECYLNCRRMELGGLRNLQAKRRGFCGDYIDTVEENIFQHFDCSCMPYFEPVCGSDGRTYPNVCFLQCVNMYYPQILLVDQNACLNKLDVIVQTGIGMGADYGVANYNYMSFVPNIPMY